MARIRSIKPEYWTGDDITECSMPARLLFIGLWNFADDGGAHPASPKKIKGEIFPMDDISREDVRRLLDELEQHDQLKRYTIGGKDYFQIIGWHHQKIDRPQKNKFPRPEEADMQNKDGVRRGIDEHSPLIGEERIGYDKIGEDETRAAEAPPPTKPEDTSKNSQKYGFEGHHVKLSQKDFDAWAKAYPKLDLVAELQNRDDWLRGEPDRQKNWYVATSNWLRTRNSVVVERLAPAKHKTRKDEEISAIRRWWNSGKRDGLWIVNSYGEPPGNRDCQIKWDVIEAALGNEDFEKFCLTIPEELRREATG